MGGFGGRKDKQIYTQWSVNKTVAWQFNSVLQLECYASQVFTLLVYLTRYCSCCSGYY